MSTKITKTYSAAARVLISSIEFRLQVSCVHGDIILGNTNKSLPFRSRSLAPPITCSEAPQKGYMYD